MNMILKSGSKSWVPILMFACVAALVWAQDAPTGKPTGTCAGGGKPAGPCTGTGGGGGTGRTEGGGTEGAKADPGIHTLKTEFDSEVWAASRRADAACHRGYELELKGDYDGAVKAFKEALEYEPTNDDILLDLSRAQRRVIAPFTWSCDGSPCEHLISATELIGKLRNAPQDANYYELVNDWILHAWSEEYIRIILGSEDEKEVLRTIQQLNSKTIDIVEKTLRGQIARLTPFNQDTPELVARKRAAIKDHEAFLQSLLGAARSENAGIDFYCKVFNGNCLGYIQNGADRKLRYPVPRAFNSLIKIRDKGWLAEQ
jgi:tetratricopeptide (TPR) repeat protein